MAISVQSNLVNVDVIVTDQDGNLVTGLKRENFRVLDDGQPQQVTNFSPTEAPITVVILMEYSSTYWGYYQGYFGAKAQYWADGFLQHLNRQRLGGAQDIRPPNKRFKKISRRINAPSMNPFRTLGFPTFQ